MTDAADSVLDAVLDAASDGVAIVDDDGRVATANDALVAMFDGDRTAVAGVDWRSLFAEPLDADDLLAGDGVDATLANADGEDRSLVVGTVDGTPVTASATRADDQFVVTVADRTAAVERDRLERVLESVDDGIYMLDADGRIEYINNAALDAHDFSYDRDDVVGAYATKMLSADDLQACVEAIQSLIYTADATSEQVPVSVTDADGSAVPAELNLSLLPPDDDGGYAGSVGVLRDVTERRRRDQMLRVLNRVLRHNLRNDMNVVIGMSQAIEAGADADVAQYTRRIRDVATDLVELGGKANVVEALTGPSTNACEPADVVPVVEHAVDTATVDHDRSAVSVDAPPSATALVPPLFEVAVENVVGNALEHGTGPVVDVSVETNGDVVRVAVTDDGPGIPTVELDALRADRETPLEHASGLGLWLTNWIVDLVDGDVTYTVDDGTTVTIELPAAD